MNLSEGPPLIKTRADLEAVLAQMARDDSKIKLRCAERDLEITKVRERYKDVDQLAAGLANGETAVMTWGKANKQEFPEGKRSLEFRHGTCRYRLGNPRLAVLDGWTIKTVLLKMQGLRKRFGRWIKKKEEPDLRKLLAAARAKSNTVTAKELASVGLALCQDDAFSFELHQETPAP